MYVTACIQAYTACMGSITTNSFITAQVVRHVARTDEVRLQWKSLPALKKNCGYTDTVARIGEGEVSNLIEI